MVVMLGNGEKAPYPSRNRDGPGRVSVPRGTEENSWCLSQHLPSGGSDEGQRRATAGLCMQSSAQGWADTRGQISTPTTPAPTVAAMDEAQSQLRGRAQEPGLGDRWAQSSSAPNLTHSQWKRCWEIHTWGSMYTSPVPCLQEMCIPREVPLPWQHQPHDTALCEESGSAHSGHTEEAAQAALPHSESQHSHQGPTKYFLSFFYRNYYKKLVNLEHL